MPLFSMDKDTIQIEKDTLTDFYNHNVSVELHTYILIGLSIQYEYLLNNKIKNNRIKDRDGLVFGTTLNPSLYGGYFQYTIYEGKFPDIEQEGFGILIGHLGPFIQTGPVSKNFIIPYYSYMWRDEDEYKGTWTQYGLKVFFIAPGFGISYGFHF